MLCPVSNAGERLTDKRKSRLRTIETTRPPAERGRIGRSVWVFERRRRLLPGAVLHKAPTQCLTTSQQAVMGVRERKPGQEREGLPATGTPSAANVNPVVMLVVRLLATTAMADDRILPTNRALPQNNLGATGRPIRFQLVRWDGKWDKDNRIYWSSALRTLTRQDPCRKRSSSSYSENPN
jgi:hypothetical protein